MSRNAYALLKKKLEMGGYEMFIWNGEGAPDNHQKWGWEVYVSAAENGGKVYISAAENVVDHARPAEGCAKKGTPLRVFFAPSLIS